MSFTVHLVTVSTSRTALAEDHTGAALADRIEALGGTVAGRTLVTDDRAALEEVLRRQAGKVDVLCFAGGTGASPHDVTPEALRPLLEKELPGLGECMRQAGLARIGSRAYLSRSFGGISAGTVILGVPGSPGGACDSLVAVAPLLEHLARISRGQVRDCQEETGGEGCC